jgi:hypothetical protein
VRLSDKIWNNNHPRIILDKHGSIWFSGYRGKDSKVKFTTYNECQVMVKAHMALNIQPLDVGVMVIIALKIIFCSTLSRVIIYHNTLIQWGTVVVVSYGSWIYNYLWNQCLSPLKLRVQIPLRWGVLDTTLCDKVCQWLAASHWFSPISSTNKTDHHDLTEILLKVVLKFHKPNRHSRAVCL